jgi:hypothetical protein
MRGSPTATAKAPAQRATCEREILSTLPKEISADYGEQIVPTLSAQLAADFGDGFSLTMSS